MATREPSQRITILLGVIAAMILLVLLIWGAVVLIPTIGDWVSDTFSPGLGLKTAAIVAAVVAFLALIVMTVTAGDGLLGEVQFLIPGFFSFFLFFWLMIAWVF